MSYQLIGLAGKAGSGKDYLTTHYLEPMGYKKLSFAWLLKWVAVAQGECTWEEAFVTKPKHVRTILQRLGTDEWRANYGEDVWIRGLDAMAKTLESEWGVSKFVVADVRFPNEMFAVQKLGKCFRLHAPERVAGSALTDEQRGHESEIALDFIPLEAYDGVVQNDPQYATSVLYQIENLVGLAQLPLLK